MVRKIVSIAPARTCLFGDHQDYLGLPIIACAINRHITLTAIENNFGYFELNMPDIQQKRIISVQESLENIDKNDHFLSALKVLKRYNCIANRGFTIEIKGTIPINSGTSSSSALVVAWVQFLIKAFGDDDLLKPETISQIAYQAEVVEHNAPGGKMDQFSIGLGNIIYLETGENFSYKVVEKSFKGLIMAESGVPKDTVGLLSRLKTNAWKAINEVKKHIPDFEIQYCDFDQKNHYLSFVNDELKPYLRAAIGNYEVTKKALKEFEKKNLDIKEVGDLMNEHHHYLKNDLEITVPKIDIMIDAALKAGAYGAKIVGSGGGGSIAVLCDEKIQDTIIDSLKTAGAVNVYPVVIERGAYIKETNYA